MRRKDVAAKAASAIPPRARALLGILLAALWLNCARAQQPPAFRLPADIVPLAYAADLTLSPADSFFHGRLEIDVQIRRPTSLIWLNATALTLESAEVSQEGEVQPAQSVAGGDDFVGLSTGALLRPGKARLRIAYLGRVSAGGEGLFRRDYRGAAYLLTQFQPDSARRVFPCFDEPGLKATWQLTLHIPRDQAAFTNARIESEITPRGEMKTVRFARTPPLATNLVALAVGPFELVEAGHARKSHTAVRIATPKGEAARAQFAAAVTTQVLDWFEAYLGVSYAFDKLDLITNPSCSSGAMEHPGLVTFCGPQLLALPEQDSPRRQRDFTRTLAHEIAHQWFGNLVTPAWWDEVWLSEGFANWLQGKYLASVHPEWNFRVDELRSRSSLLQADGLANPRAVHAPVDSKSAIRDAFGPAVYVKGAAVLDMFDRAVGEEAFRRILRQYLDAHRFSIATTEDWLAAVSAVAGAPRGAAFAKFISQPGAPLVSAALECSADRAPAIRLSQRRATSIPGASVPARLWDIPVCLTYEGSGSPRCEWLQAPALSLALPQAVACPKWVLLNPDATGYFRGAYDETQFQNLIGPGWEHLSLVNQILTIDERYAAILAGSAQAASGLSAIAQLAGTLAPETLRAAAEAVQGIGAFVPEDSRTSYASYVQHVFGERARMLGWRSAPQENARLRLLRGPLLQFVAIDGRDVSLQQQARALALEWVANGSNVNAEVIGPMLVAAALSGDTELFESYLSAVPRVNDPREQGLLLRALGSFSDAAIEQRARNLLLSERLTVRQWLTAMTVRPARAEFAAQRFRFVTEHIDRILEKMRSEQRSELLVDLPGVAHGACSAELAKDVANFFRPRIAAISGATSALNDVLDELSACDKRREMQSDNLREYWRTQPALPPASYPRAG